MEHLGLGYNSVFRKSFWNEYLGNGNLSKLFLRGGGGVLRGCDKIIWGVSNPVEVPEAPHIYFTFKGSVSQDF
jgi:hypothetical protein